MNTFKLLGLDNVEEREKERKKNINFIQHSYGQMKYNNYFKYFGQI